MFKKFKVLKVEVEQRCSQPLQVNNRRLFIVRLSSLHHLRLLLSVSTPEGELTRRRRYMRKGRKRGREECECLAVKLGCQNRVSEGEGGGGGAAVSVGKRCGAGHEGGRGSPATASVPSRPVTSGDPLVSNPFPRFPLELSPHFTSYPPHLFPCRPASFPRRVPVAGTS